MGALHQPNLPKQPIIIDPPIKNVDSFPHQNTAGIRKLTKKETFVLICTLLFLFCVPPITTWFVTKHVYMNQLSNYKQYVDTQVTSVNEKLTQLNQTTMQIIQLSQLEKMIDDNLRNYNLELETLKNKKEYVDTIIKMKELDALIIKTMYIKENIKTIKQNTNLK